MGRLLVRGVIRMSNVRTLEWYFPRFVLWGVAGHLHSARNVRAGGSHAFQLGSWRVHGQAPAMFMVLFLGRSTVRCLKSWACSRS